MPLMPVVFVPHGGGPMPLMDDPAHQQMVHYLKGLSAQLPPPKAILVVSAHWEQTQVTVTSNATPELFFDYYGFPEQTYHYTYPAPGDPALASDIVDLLISSGIDAKTDNSRGLDHGVFVPLKLIYPEAAIPVLQISLRKGLDPHFHIALGQALAPLREQGVLILGSGMSFHNMQAFFRPSAQMQAYSEAFHQWLKQTLCDDDKPWEQRQALLEQWEQAPFARFNHPREEHLIPALVCFGAAQQSPQAQASFDGEILNKPALGLTWQ